MYIKCLIGDLDSIDGCLLLQFLSAAAAYIYAYTSICLTCLFTFSALHPYLPTLAF